MHYITPKEMIKAPLEKHIILEALSAFEHVVSIIPPITKTLFLHFIRLFCNYHYAILRFTQVCQVLSVSVNFQRDEQARIFTTSLY